MIILGAGLAGLSAAYHSDGLVYEKEDTAGGTCRSVNRNGYTFDFGIHVLHTKNDYVLNLFIKKLGVSLYSKNRQAWIYSRGVFTKYPFQVNTYGLPDDIKRECVEGFKLAYAKRKKITGGFDNYEDWVYCNFGKGIAEHFYLPYSEKFWTIPAKRMGIDWLDVRVPIPKLRDVVEGSRRIIKKEFGPNALFRYPKKGGIESLPVSFLGGLKNRIHFGKKAVRVDILKKSIEFSDGTKTLYDKLVSTIPAPDFINAVKEGQLSSGAAMAVKALKCNSILCVNIGVRRLQANKFHWIYYPEDKYCFFRISFPKNFSGLMAPKNCFSVSAEIAYSSERSIKKNNITDRVIKDLIGVKILKAQDRIEFIDVQDIKYGYPIYTHDRAKNMKVINSFLKEHGIYTAGRYGRWEYQWMDDAVLDGKRAIEEVLNK